MSFGRNIALNLLGQGAPLIAAAVCIPHLIERMGTDRFGVLTIAWMVIGYFSFFDLGLGRALTQAVAEKLGLGQLDAVPGLVATALTMMLGLGVFAGALLAVTTPMIVDHVVNTPAAYARETTHAMWLLAASLPFVIVTTGLRGVLEAYHRFDLTNMVRIPMGIWTFVGPLLVLPFSPSLAPIVLVLAIGRVLTTLWHVLLVWRVVLASRSADVRYDAASARRLLTFGGWMTVSNVIGPMMVYLDRFIISAVIGLSVVAYYTTPYEVIFKLNVLPEAVFTVLFPLMSSQFATARRGDATLFSTGVKLMAAAMFPAALIGVLLAYDFLHWWVGPEFAVRSTRVMQLLAIGIFLNSMAKVPYNLVQARGRADLTAKLHLVELPLYVGTLIVSLHALGIVGAALTWAGRMLLDLCLLTWIARRTAPLDRAELGSAVRVIGGLGCALVLAVPVPHGTPAIAALGLMLTFYAAAYYRLILSPLERVAFKVALGRRLGGTHA